MAETSYTFDLAEFPNAAFDLAKLESEIRASPITIALAGSLGTEASATIVFRAGLSEAEEIILSDLVAAHDGVPLSVPQEVRLAGATTFDNKLRVSAEKSSAPTRNIYSHDFTDRTTWWTASVFVSHEQADALDEERQVFVLDHPFVIDTLHAKISNEEALRVSAEGYAVSVWIDSVLQTEADPHTGDGDYQVNYQTGRITFVTPVALGAVVEVTYRYATTSAFEIVPQPGKNVTPLQAEIQFTTDIEIQDTLRYQVMVWDPENEVHVPHGEPTVFKCFKDYLNDSQRAYPTYPGNGTVGNWRALPVPSIIMDWDYLGENALKSLYGAKLRIWLEHDEPFTGTFCAATFYTREDTVV